MKDHAGLFCALCYVERRLRVLNTDSNKNEKIVKKKRWKERRNGGKWEWVVWWGGLLWGPAWDDDGMELDIVVHECVGFEGESC